MKMNVKSKTLCGIYIIFILQASIFAQKTCKKGITSKGGEDGYTNVVDGSTSGIPEDAVCETNDQQCLRIEMDELIDGNANERRKFFIKSTYKLF